jgi:hypothetical protein
MVVLGGVVVSYERGTPGHGSRVAREHRLLSAAANGQLQLGCAPNECDEEGHARFAKVPRHRATIWAYGGGVLMSEVSL